MYATDRPGEFETRGPVAVWPRPAPSGRMPNADELVRRALERKRRRFGIRAAWRTVGVEPCK